MQFIGTLATMTGAGVFLLASMFAWVLLCRSRYVDIHFYKADFQLDQEEKCDKPEKRTGGLSAEIQETYNFKVIIAFNRREFQKAI